MTSSTLYHFEGCNLRKLGSRELVLLSGCWRLDRIRMEHRPDGKVDLALDCELGTCLCAQAMRKGKVCREPTPCEAPPPP